MKNLKSSGSLKDKDKYEQIAETNVSKNGNVRFTLFFCLLQVMPNLHFDDLGFPVWRNHQNELPNNDALKCSLCIMVFEKKE